jgi:hypothetical protein
MALVARGYDCSWDPPDQQCMKNAGYAFMVRYASRDPSQAGKNLTRAELDSALAKGLGVCVVWQDSKSQMKGGYSAGTSHAGSADSFVRGLGLGGIPVYFACDFDPVSSDWAAVDGYCDGVKAVLGKSRAGGYGGYSFIKRELDAGRITWAWQTYAWSGSPTTWDARAQMRQVKNDYARCDGYIDDDEAHAADYGQWPRPAAAAPQQAEALDPVCLPPRAVSGRQVSVCLNGPHRDFGICVDASVLQGSVHIRAALHLISGGWHVIQVYADPGHDRVVVSPPSPYDGASLHRQDDQPVDVWPVFTA